VKKPARRPPKGFVDLDAIDHKYAHEGATRAIKVLRERGVVDGGRSPSDDSAAEE
jgi:hypothetical protein